MVTPQSLSSESMLHSLEVILAMLELSCLLDECPHVAVDVKRDQGHAQRTERNPQQGRLVHTMHVEDPVMREEEKEG